VAIAVAELSFQLGIHQRHGAVHAERMPAVVGRVMTERAERKRAGESFDQHLADRAFPQRVDVGFVRQHRICRRRAWQAHRDEGDGSNGQHVDNGHPDGTNHRESSYRPLSGPSVRLCTPDISSSCVHKRTDMRTTRPYRGLDMKFINLYLAGYFVLVVGVVLALWQSGVLARVAPVWIGIGVLVAIGLGIMMSVSSGKPTTTEKV
jgi:hypothetical protein